MNELLLRRRAIIGMTGSKEPINYFDADVFWENGTFIGNNINGFLQYEFQVPYGNYIISTNVINNESANIASVMARQYASNASPSSGGNGVFVDRPRQIANTSTVAICIRTISSGYLHWDKESFSPYYIKIEKI